MLPPPDTDRQTLLETGFDEGFEEKLVLPVMLAAGVGLGDVEVERVRKPDASLKHFHRPLPDFFKGLDAEFIGTAEHVNVAVKTADTDQSRILDFFRNLIWHQHPALRQGPGVNFRKRAQTLIQHRRPFRRCRQRLQPDVHILGFAVQTMADDGHAPQQYDAMPRSQGMGKGFRAGQRRFHRRMSAVI